MNECRDGIDYRKFYDANIESYLLTEVRGRFENSGKITPLDFYLILHWKAPRVKNVHKERLKRRANGNFACAVDQIAEALHGTSDPKGRLAILMENEKWGFRLPTATAVLTILFPQEFTVYANPWEILATSKTGDFLKTCGVPISLSGRKSSKWKLRRPSYLFVTKTVISGASLFMNRQKKTAFDLSFYHLGLSWWRADKINRVRAFPSVGFWPRCLSA
jgi:hypothetical protein